MAISAFPRWKQRNNKDNNLSPKAGAFLISLFSQLLSSLHHILLLLCNHQVHSNLLSQSFIRSWKSTSHMPFPWCSLEKWQIDSVLSLSFPDPSKQLSMINTYLNYHNSESWTWIKTRLKLCFSKYVMWSWLYLKFQVSNSSRKSRRPNLIKAKCHYHELLTQSDYIWSNLIRIPCWCYTQHKQMDVSNAVK